MTLTATGAPVGAPYLPPTAPAASPAALSPRVRGGSRVPFGALGAFALVVGLVLLVRSPIVVAGDDSMYVILAKSLATGQGYRFLNLPGAPAATHFPPGYPALLALLWRVAPSFPANLALFKLVNAVCLALVAVATARIARAATGSQRAGLAVGALVAVSGPMLILGNMLLSELLFLALLLPLLVALERFVGPDAPSARRTRDAVALGVAIAACTLVRTHGVVLVPAAALLLARRRRWRDAALLGAVAVACLLPWQLWSMRHGGVLPAPLLGQYDSYVGWWVRGYRALGAPMLGMTLRRTATEVAGMFAILFSPGRDVVSRSLTLVAVAAVILVGVRAESRRAPVTMLFLAGYLAIVLLWPFPPSRFVWGIWPLAVVVLASGLAAIARTAMRWSGLPVMHRALVVAGGAAGLWLAAGYGTYEWRAIRGQWWNSIPRANAARIVPAVRWTLAHTAPGDLVAAEDDGAMYLYTGRRTLPVRTFTVQQYLAPIDPRIEAEQGLVPLLARYPVQVVVVGSPTASAAARWLASSPTPLVSPGDEFPGGTAFTVLPR